VTPCDVLVIGLGPAGASAAAAAARAGRKVIALERKRTVGVPVQCAEFIPLPLARHAPAESRAQAIEAMATYLPSGERTERAFGGLMIRRDRFDQALAQAAADAGAELWLEAPLEKLDAEAGTARAKGKAIRFRAAIAADGPHSTAAALLGLERLPTVHTRQYTVPLARPHADTDIWLSPRYPGGYAWLFPKGEVANLGLGFDAAIEPDLKAPLEELHAALVKQGRVGREILFRTGGPIPVGGLRERLVRGKVAFAGDAAGLTHPVTGAGIAQAVLSGERAGEAAAAGALAAYEEEMREEFGPALERALAVRRRMAEAWKSRDAGDAAHRRGWIAFEEYYA
jgi:geranylgeranyl reductase family protein